MTTPTFLNTGLDREGLIAVKALGTVQDVAQADHADGETLLLTDTTATLYTFYYNVTGGYVPGGGYDAVNIEVDVSGATSAQEVAEILVAAINAAAIAATASTPVNGLTTVVQDTGGIAGNNTVTETVADAAYVVTGFAGGFDANIGSPMEPAQWLFAVTAGGEEVAGFGDALPPEGVEDFEEGWAASVPAVLVSLSEPFTLVDGSILQVTQEGGVGVSQVQFNSVDFPDIANASASEVRAVLQAQLTLGAYTVELSFGRILLKSAPFGLAIEVIGLSSANDVLGFPRPVDEFIGEDLDIVPAEWTDAPAVTPTIESFEVRWAGLAAVQYSEGVETFALTNLNTLLVAIDGGAPQVVTFNTGDFAAIGAATAAEVAAVLTTQLTGATGEADPGGRVAIRSAFIGVGSSVEVTGGTDFAAFTAFYPLAAVIVGNENDGTVLAFSTAALWDTAIPTGSEDVEDFEDGWDSNESFTHILTKDQIVVIATPVAGHEYTLTVNSESFDYTASAGDTPAIVAGALASEADANSSFVGATALGAGVLELERLNSRESLTLSVSVVDSDSSDITATSMIVSTDAEDPVTTASALWDSGTPEDVEDFEEEWLSNGSFVWNLTDDEIAVTALHIPATQYTITVTIPSTETGPTSVVASATEATPSALATALAATLNAASEIAAVAVGPVITVTRADTRTELQIAVSDTGVLLVGADDTLGGGVEAAVWRNVGATPTFAYEEFEPVDGDFVGTNVPWQHSVHILVSAVGRYSIFVQGVEVFYVAGVEPPSSIASGLVSDAVTKLAPLGLEALTSAIDLDKVHIRSTTAPVTDTDDIGVSAVGPNANDVEVEPPSAREADNWTWGAFLRTL